MRATLLGLTLLAGLSSAADSPFERFVGEYRIAARDCRTNGVQDAAARAELVGLRIVRDHQGLVLEKLGRRGTQMRVPLRSGEAHPLGDSVVVVADDTGVEADTFSRPRTDTLLVLRDRLETDAAGTPVYWEIFSSRSPAPSLDRSCRFALERISSQNHIESTRTAIGVPCP